jgi:hypothetical protein
LLTYLFELEDMDMKRMTFALKEWQPSSTNSLKWRKWR